MLENVYIVGVKNSPSMTGFFMVLDRREAMSILKYIKIILVLLFKAYLVYLWINSVETFTQLLYYKIKDWIRSKKQEAPIYKVLFSSLLLLLKLCLVVYILIAVSTVLSIPLIND